jgi:hypothetical protein
VSIKTIRAPPLPSLGIADVTGKTKTNALPLVCPPDKVKAGLPNPSLVSEAVRRIPAGPTKPTGAMGRRGLEKNNPAPRFSYSVFAVAT